MATISDSTALECLWSPCGVKSSLEYKEVGRGRARIYKSMCILYQKKIEKPLPILKRRLRCKLIGKA